MDLAAQPSSTPVALKTIAERNDISLQFLEHIFASFRRTGIVKSVKGSQGGYNLAKAADEITVASVVEALEGSYHLEDEDVVAENSYKGISDTIQKLVVDTVNQELDQILSNLTLAQMSGYYSDHYEKQDRLLNTELCNGGQFAFVSLQKYFFDEIKPQKIFIIKSCQGSLFDSVIKGDRLRAEKK